MSNGVIVLMLVLAVICVMLATQPAPPPRSRRSRLPDQVKNRRPATETDGGNGSQPQPDDTPHDHRFSALHPSSNHHHSIRGASGEEQTARTIQPNQSAAEAALSIWPSNDTPLR